MLVSNVNQTDFHLLHNEHAVSVTRWCCCLGRTRCDSSLFATSMNTALWIMAVVRMTSCHSSIRWLLNAALRNYQICSLSHSLNMRDPDVYNMSLCINNACCVVVVVDMRALAVLEWRFRGLTQSNKPQPCLIYLKLMWIACVYHHTRYQSFQVIWTWCGCVVIFWSCYVLSLNLEKHV